MGLGAARATGAAVRAAARSLLAAAALTVLAACYGNDPRFSVVPPPDPVQPVVAAPALPFEDAVVAAAAALFGNARLPPAADGPSGRHPLVIDPLIDGMAGARSAATVSMESRIASLVHGQHSDRFDLQPLSTAALSRSPLVLLGSFTGLGPGGRTVGPPDAYRIWLVLVDLRSGRIVARGVARALPAGVDTSPAAFERDSPLWLAADGPRRAYLRTCEGAIGDAVDPAYLDGVFASALVADAMASYDAGRHRDALGLFEAALRAPGGEQLRTYNGLYLTHRALGRRAEAEQAFARAVDFGLRHGSLAVKLVFRPASTLFWPDPAVSGAYPVWLRQIARRTSADTACLRLTGHTSPTGPRAFNDRLSLARAETIRTQLVEEAPPLGPRTGARGVGSQQPVVGTGRDDATDLLDRRVEFDLVPCDAVRSAPVAEAREPVSRS